MEMIPLLLAMLVVMIWTYRWHQKSKNLPPGPWNLPIVGYLPWLNPKAPYLSLTELSKKYGPIYGLYLGSVYTVVIADPRIIKKTFNKDAACGRAPLHLTFGLMNGYGLICAEGDLWKDQRKFVHNTLRSLGASKVSANRDDLDLLITHHVKDFVQYVKSQGREAVLDPTEPLRHSLGSAINRIVFGRAWSRDDETWKWLQHLQEEGTKHIGVAGPLNFLPMLRFLPKSKQTMRFLIEGKHETHKIYEQIIKEQGENGDNFIGAFLTERKKRHGSETAEYYNDQQFYHLLADIFGASLDTTLTTLRWYLLYMAVHRDEQEKVRQELGGTASRDLSSLPYLQASVAEIQRIRSVVPVGIPHGSLEQMYVGDYLVPKGTMMVPLQWAIHMDPDVWQEPELFKPERFIDEGKFSKPEAFLPFQIGKRMCVGEELAKMFLFSFGAAIIENFQISCADGGRIDLMGDCGITLTPKQHKLVFTSL